MSHRALRHLAGAAAAALVAATALTGCFTGDRPTLADGPAMTGDPAVDAVLSRLEDTRNSVFTAGYDVITRFGDVHSTATVVQAGPARRSITVGSVRFLVEGADSATCEVGTGSCSTTLDAARISDTQLAPDFYATSAAIRLRRDLAAAIGPAEGSTTTIAGRPATCVVIPLTTGDETVCALDGGPLARIDAADLLIDMTSWSAAPEEAAFSRS
jgi:hypothetical protein